MSRILKVAIGVVAAVLVVAGAAVVYRETDLMTGSLVVLAGLMIAALLARRAAEREERAGMADWEDETQASADAADDLFGEWALSSPRDERARPTTSPTSADTTPPDAPAWTASPTADTTPAPPTVPPTSLATPPELERFDALPPPEVAPAAASEPAGQGPDTGRSDRDDQALVASLFAGDAPPARFEPLADDPDPFGLGDLSPARPTPAFAGAAASTDHRSPIDWTGQGGRVDERVRSSEDILRVSEVTALPSTVETGGSELARLLSKVEARLREYD